MSRRIIFITLSVPVFALCGMFIMVLAYLSCSESYNPFVPYADTRFAAGYTAESFDRVKPGMSRDEVYTLLGTAPGGRYCSERERNFLLVQR